MTSRFRASAAIFWAVVLVVIANGARVPAEPHRVELPPFLVEERAQPLRWLYLKSGDVEILSTCTQGATRQFAVQYQRQRELLRWVFPERYLARVKQPFGVLLIDGATARRVTDQTMAQWLAQTAGHREIPGREPQVLPNMRLAGLDHCISMVVHPHRASEAVHFYFSPSHAQFLLENMVPALAPWASVGLLAAYEDLRFLETAITVERLGWNPADALGLRTDPDWPRDVWPLEVLFSHWPEAMDARAESWRQQLRLFVRWAALADDRTRVEAFWRWVDHCADAPPNEDAFRACFGVGYAQARDALSDYLPRAVEETFQIDARGQLTRPRLDVRAATPSEVGRLKAEWERASLQLVREREERLAPGYLEQARQTLRRARESAPYEAALLGASGVLEYEAGRTAAACDLLERALLAGERRPLVRLYVARARRAAVGAARSTVVPLTPEEVRHILAPLRTAPGDSQVLEIYQLRAEVLEQAASPPSAEDLRDLAEGVRLFWNTPSFVAQVVRLMAKNGGAAEGRELLELCLAKVPPALRRPYETVRQEISPHS